MNPRKGPTRAVSRDDSKRYLSNAEEHLAAAQEMLDISSDDSRAKAAAMQAVHAAIAFGDALTAARLGLVNTENHQQLPALVRTAAGKSAINDQISRLQRIMSRKDQADYGPARWHREDAHDLVVQVERFAAWIRDLLR